MTQRFDVTTPRPRKNSDKPYWHKVGTAFADDRGGMTAYLDSLPLQDSEGRCVLKLFEAKERQRPSDVEVIASTGAASMSDTLDDDIPF